jgi:hypothetical protein
MRKAGRRVRFPPSRFFRTHLCPPFFSPSKLPPLFPSRVYCSTECESLDSSAASSAYASPYLSSTHPTGNADIPALVPSVRHSISSANSSTVWSTTPDEEEAGESYLYLSEATPDMLSEGSRSPAFNSGLFYARRPSATNQRATVPMLHRHASSASSFTTSSRGLASPFYAPTEDDAASVCISELSLHDDDPGAARRKAKRTSLPAYFSLLQGSAPSAPQQIRRQPSALQAVSRSLHSSHLAPPAVSYAEAHAPSAPRRGRQPGRPHQHLAPPVDGVEKVAEWVSSSQPSARPTYELLESFSRSLRDSALASDEDEDEDLDGTVRGRRRVEELDEPVKPGAPGYGNGRSGLKARERIRGRLPLAATIVH